MVSIPSLENALGLAYLGARGETASEMARATGFDPDVLRAGQKLSADKKALLAAAGGAELTIANRLWVDKSFPILPDYQSATTSGGTAGLELVDFQHQSNAALGNINGWVSRETKGKIPSLLEGDAVNAGTRLVITNAIYFHGTWATKFDAKDTHDEPFLASTAGKSNVRMMHQTSTLYAATFDGGKLLELPYARSDLAMDIVLPDHTAGLAALEAKIDGGINAWTSHLAERSVQVSLPKFSFSSGGSLKEALEQRGMRRAFSGDADFSGISARPNSLLVSDVVQKTFVSVDEVGTEAAAATGIPLNPSVSIALEPLVFKADHPFLFAIRDRKSGKVLFMGRFTGST
jgi:serpin B